MKHTHCIYHRFLQLVDLNMVSKLVGIITVAIAVLITIILIVVIAVIASNGNKSDKGK